MAFQKEIHQQQQKQQEQRHQQQQAEVRLFRISGMQWWAFGSAKEFRFSGGLTGPRENLNLMVDRRNREGI